MNDDDTGPVKQLLVGVGALVAVALLIGGLVSAMALGAADVVGLAGDEPGPTQEPSLYFPEPRSSPSPVGGSSPSEPPTAKRSERPDQAGEQDRGDRKDREDRRQRNRQKITLSASPEVVEPFERIYLTGSYRGGNGATLQVQRFEGGWSDFPVTATVQGGRFSTYVQSGQSGLNRFRMVDTSSGRASDPVSVDIR